MDERCEYQSHWGIQERCIRKPHANDDHWFTTSQGVPSTTDDYWDEVDAAEVWFQVFLGHHFDRVRAGSGDAWMDLKALKNRLDSEGLETVGQNYDRKG